MPERGVHPRSRRFNYRTPDGAPAESAASEFGKAMRRERRAPVRNASETVLAGAFVYQLGHGPLKAERRVRFPYALPEAKPETISNEKKGFCRAEFEFEEFVHLDFGFASDFDIRISDLP